MKKPTAKEKAISRKLMDTYSDHSKETSTFADLLQESMRRKESKGEKES